VTTIAEQVTTRAQAHAQARLAADLAALGVPAGRDVLVHCSLRRVGRIAGGPGTLVAALRDVLGPASTIVVPTHTTGNSTTTRRFRATATGLTAPEVAAMEARLPAFDPVAATSHGMGAMAEYVRRAPEAVRSGHPQTSFAALGPRAPALTAVHDLDCHLGERSPLGTLYAAGAVILLLGVGYDACTALHLAEYKLPWDPPDRRYRCYVIEGGRRVPKEFVAPDLDDRDFPALGADLDQTPLVRKGPVGNAPSRLIEMCGTVDFAVEWLTARRGP
jgi:aminoglycoside 3-N-acetyltransferase